MPRGERRLRFSYLSPTVVTYHHIVATTLLIEVRQEKCSLSAWEDQRKIYIPLLKAAKNVRFQVVYQNQKQKLLRAHNFLWLIKNHRTLLLNLRVGIYALSS